jgi:flagellar hook-length control protein FliK
MSTVDFSKFSAMPLDLLHLEQGGTGARSGSDQLFEAYLNRAKTAPAVSDDEKRTSTSRDDDRAAAPKVKNDRRSDEPKKTSAKKEAADDPADGRESLAKSDSKDDAASATDNSARNDDSSDATATAKSSNEGDEKPKDQNGALSPDRNDAKENETNALEKGVAEEKKKTEGEGGILDLLAQSGDAVLQIIPAIAAASAQRQVENSQETNAAGETTNETATAIQVSATGELPGGLGSENAKTPDVKSAAANAAANAGTIADAAGVIPQAASETAGDSTANSPGEGKSKAKKTGEAAVELKAALRKQNAADDGKSNASDASAPTDAAAGNSPTDALKGAAAMTPTTNAPPTPDAMKLVEKLEKAAGTSGGAEEVRSATPTQSNPTPAARESGAAKAAQGPDMSSADFRAKFIERVEKAFEAMGERTGSLKLRLSPAELGSLKLEVSVQKGELRARIEAETPTARSLLLDNLPALREKLAEQNINIKQFDVDLTDRQPGGMSQQTFGQSNSDSQQRNRFSPRANLSESAAPASAPSTARRAGMGDGLNVIV